MKQSHQIVTTFSENMNGNHGIAMSPISPSGIVKMNNLIYEAFSDVPIRKGDRVTVTDQFRWMIKVIKG